MGLGFGSGSSGEKDSSSMNEEDMTRTMCTRHTTYQTQMLEAFYRDNPQPTEEQRRELSREIGLDVKQIKFWYQNKKALSKAQVDRADNNVLRAENEKMSYENEALKEALNTIVCFECGGPSNGGNSDLQQLVNENANLKQEFGKIAKVIAKYTGKLPLLQVDSVVKKTAGAAPSSCVMNNEQVPSVSVMMMNNYNNVDHRDAAGLGSTIPPPPPPSPMMNYNAAALNQPQGIPNSYTPPPPPPMMNYDAALNYQGNIGIPTSSTLAPPPPMMMNNYDTTAAFNHQQQGIFGSTLAPAPDGLLMPENNLLIQSSPNHLEPGAMETDNNFAASVEGPTTLAELMKLLG